MTMTQEELAAVAARFMERRKLSAEKLVAAAAESVRKAETKAKTKRPFVNRQKASARSAEVGWLLGLKARLLADLREVGEDKVQPPVLEHFERIIRPDAQYDSKNGNMGPRDSEQIELRIDVALLVIYQEQCPRAEAIKWMLERVPGLTQRAMDITFSRYATDYERGYRPYLYKSQRVTFGEVQQELALRQVAFATELPPETVLESQTKYWFRCLAVSEHRHWEAVLTVVRTRKSGCALCGYIRTGIKNSKKKPIAENED